MDFASVAKQLGGTPLGEASQQQNSPTPQAPSVSDFSSVAQNLGGTPNGVLQNKPQDNRSFGQKALDVAGTLTGTKGAGEDIGGELASGYATKEYQDAVKSFSDVSDSLLKAIKTKQAAGQDTTHLEQVLHQHLTQDAPDLYNFAPDALKKTNEQIVGDFGQLAANALLGAETKSLSVGGKILANTGIGAAMGAATGMSDNQDASGIAKQAAFGGLVGGGASALAEGISHFANKLPNRIVNQVLPQLKDPATVDYAVKNLKLGTVNGMVENSEKALESYDSQINALLSHPDVADKPIQGMNIIQKTLDNFPNSEYTADTLIAKMKSQVPAQAKLFTTLAEGGTLPLDEANNLRKAIDRVTYKSVIDSPEVRAGKELAQAFGHALRSTIQDTVPETKTIFSNYSKEIALKQALDKLAAKGAKESFVNFSDLVSAGVGNSMAGIPGAIGGAISNEVTRNPAVKIATAKIIKAATPAIKSIGKAVSKTAPLSGRANINQ